MRAAGAQIYYMCSHNFCVVIWEQRTNVHAEGIESLLLTRLLILLLSLSLSLHRVFTDHSAVYYTALSLSLSLSIESLLLT